MAHAYTPGLKVTAHTTVQKRRVLPLPGEVLPEAGQRVRGDEVIARTELPGPVRSVNVINLLGIEPEQIEQHMLKKVGDPVEAGEPIAETKPWLRWFRSTAPAPVAGTIESISRVTGQVLIRQGSRPIELRAYVDGEVAEVLPGEGAVIRCTCAMVQGIFGIGGETWGELQVVSQSPEDPLAAHDIPEDVRGKILVGGSILENDAFEKARDGGASGIIVGGFHAHHLRDILGHDLGVAITGSEQVGLTLILTEGFGRIPMARRTFDLLRALSGRRASISGATQIRAGVTRPEILVPTTETPRDTETGKPAAHGGMTVGDSVRIIREPHFGRIGVVEALPSEPTLIESESRVRIVRVRINGEVLTFPRANVEAIES